MHEPALKEKIILYKEIYSELYSALKWKLDKKSIMLIAAMYVTGEKEFSLKGFLQVADYIKENAGLFSYLKSVSRYTTAATLTVNTDDPKAGFQRLMGIYEKLIENGFARTMFTYIAAGALVNVVQEQLDPIIRKTAAIYKGMKKNHFFLTGSGDYPLAALLALREQDHDELIKNVEEYYETLYRAGFSRGNDLQFFSHILALDSSSRPEVKAERCVSINDQLKNCGFRVKRIYYPYLGMLSFLDKPDFTALFEINEQLNHVVKWNKDVNFMLAVLFLVNNAVGIGNTAATGLTVSIETLLQAQQAAMSASLAAATAASSSSSS